MTKTVRSFLAIELHKNVIAVLTDVTNTYRAAGIRDMRLVSPKDMHITIKFLGEVSSSQIESITDLLRPLSAAQESFSLKLSGISAFPHKNNPFVLWAGVSGNLQALKLLHRSIEEALMSLGYERENRRYRPHLTLARLIYDTPLKIRRMALETMYSANLHIPSVTIKTSAIMLMRSVSGLDGVTYERTARIPLSDEAPTHQ